MNENEMIGLIYSDDRVEIIISRVVESYDGNDVVELAALFDNELRREGMALTFAWLWNRATDALNE